MLKLDALLLLLLLGLFVVLDDSLLLLDELGVLFLLFQLYLLLNLIQVRATLLLGFFERM